MDALSVPQHAAIAVHRFGLGPRAADWSASSSSPQTWLRAQLTGAQLTGAQPTGAQPTEEKLSEPSLRSAALLMQWQDARRERRKADPETDKRLREQSLQVFREGVLARYQTACTSSQPLRERLVHFWSNHFAVSAEKLGLGMIAPSYENEAIRPHVCGRFADLLKAVVSHPLMLLYLDNAQSIGPASALARRAARRDRQLGLNENLAREILELHTLGVDGGYTQQDVTRFAACLTGWSMGSDRAPLPGGKPGHFFFRTDAHEPGAQTLLGKTYAQSGVLQAETVLNDLARHPATARHLAGKLARHFCGDAVPEGLIEKMAAAYLAKDTDLTALVHSLLEDARVWDLPLQKMKTPHELLIASYRIADAQPENGAQLINTLATLGQRPFSPGSPAGYDDTDARWASADALLNRIEWLHVFAQRAAKRFSMEQWIQRALGPLADAGLRKAVLRAPDAVEGLTLLLASPAFQRR